LIELTGGPAIDGVECETQKVEPESLREKVH